MPHLLGELLMRRARRKGDPDADAQNHSTHRSAQALEAKSRVTSPVPRLRFTCRSPCAQHGQ
eukprot:5520814-Alexandrium_andersonii.AAC.1